MPSDSATRQSHTSFTEETETARGPLCVSNLRREEQRRFGGNQFKLHANCEADQLRRTRELIVKLRGHARGSGSTVFSSRKHGQRLRVDLGLC